MKTPANTPQFRTCPDCGEPQKIFMNLVRSKDKRDHRFLVMGLIQIRGTIVMSWSCPVNHWHDAGTKFVHKSDKPEIRDEIVNAIRRLKTAGYKLGDWEK